jgi:hypothetical protein
MSLLAGVASSSRVILDQLVVLQSSDLAIAEAHAARLISSVLQQGLWQ